MKHRHAVCLLSLILPILGSCTNTAFVGHDQAYDANLILAADLTKVVAVNAGFESKSYAAVPPEVALTPQELPQPNKHPKGEVLSTLSSLKVQRLLVETSPGKTAGAVDFVASTATGDAAEEVANSAKAAKGAKPVAKPEAPTGKAAEITNNPASIPASQVVPLAAEAKQPQG